jgi:acetylornithine deacetylase
MSFLTNSENIQELTQEVISLLKKLIETPSFSKEEENTAA